MNDKKKSKPSDSTSDMKSDNAKKDGDSAKATTAKVKTDTASSRKKDSNDAAADTKKDDESTADNAKKDGDSTEAKTTKVKTDTASSRKKDGNDAAADTKKDDESTADNAKKDGDSTEAKTTEPKVDNKVDYSVSGGLLGRLQRLNISIAFTSYQSGLLYFIGRNVEGGINVHQTALPKPMGLCLDERNSLTMTGGYQIMRFENILESNQQINHTFDVCLVPRRVHVTGHLDAHDVGVNKDNQPVFVNTRFNCIATVSERHSFVELWRPSFISALIDEDRCHLNGMAMQDGEPRYITAVSKSNTIDGWRDRRIDGGVVIDVQANKIICEGLSMPHSPRMHNDKLWLLNSGTGELGIVNIGDDGMGQFEPKVFCPGFTRGLAFYNNLAFIGLSKPRYKRFEGLVLEDKLKESDSDPWCGVQIIDLNSYSCVDWFRIDGNITELFDLEVIPNSVCPMAVPPESNEASELVTFAPSVLD